MVNVANTNEFQRCARHSSVGRGMQSQGRAWQHRRRSGRLGPLAHGGAWQQSRRVKWLIGARHEVADIVGSGFVRLRGACKGVSARGMAAKAWHDDNSIGNVSLGRNGEAKHGTISFRNAGHGWPGSLWSGFARTARNGRTWLTGLGLDGEACRGLVGFRTTRPDEQWQARKRKETRCWTARVET